jgi:nucleoside-diphosphate-sugar epimerase
MIEAIAAGGAGFIGSNLAEEIADRQKVAVLDNFMPHP